MTYNGIITALNNGYNVFWSNSAYKVFLDNGKLYVIYKYNSYMTTLAESECNQCFVGV